jgi:outer membrane receptor for ferric coprogen and ferric-rhodotorulic acid
MFSVTCQVFLQDFFAGVLARKYTHPHSKLVRYQINSHMQVFITADNLIDRRHYQYYLAPGRSVYGGFRLKF